jgi:hypothetical protein
LATDVFLAKSSESPNLGRRKFLGYDLGRLRPFRWVALVFKFVSFVTELFGQFAEFLFGSAVEAIACRHQTTDSQAPKVGHGQRIRHNQSPDSLIPE